ncbi:uncharacterized protein LOC131465212 [Solea solea]|uniref:uncharacterized protein LOC131465212 n=1 Tax=Solea solea TaxID=90069 RepID=UPI00272B1D1F|nr:uncharacterized protein LOC131465212 [Solea solea]
MEVSSKTPEKNKISSTRCDFSPSLESCPGFCTYMFRLGTDIGNSSQTMDICDDVEPFSQTLLTVDYGVLCEILGGSPNPSSPAVPPARGFNSKLQAMESGGAQTLCQQPLHSQTIVQSRSHQNGQAGAHSQGQDLGTAHQSLSRLETELRASMQSMDPRNDLELIIQRMSGGELPDIDFEVLHKILGDSPNPLHPLNVPAMMGFSTQSQGVGSGSRGSSKPQGADPSSLHQPSMTAAGQAASTLSQRLLHNQIMMQSRGHQNGQADAYGQGQEHSTANQNRVERELHASMQVMDLSEDLELISQRILKGELPDIDIKVLRKILGESPNPLPPPNVPAATTLGAAPSSLHQPLMSAAEQAASTLCQQLLHSRAAVQSGGHQNGQAQDLTEANRSLTKLEKELGASLQGMDLREDMELITPMMLKVEMPDIDFDVLRTILEESPNPLAPPNVPAATGSNSQHKAVRSGSSGSTPLGAASPSFHQPLMSAAEQAASTLCQQLLHSQAILQSRVHQNGQTGSHSLGQDLGTTHPTLSRLETELGASMQAMDLHEDLELITHRILKGELPDVDFEVLRKILGESPNPLPPPNIPAETGFNSQPQSVGSESTGSKTLGAASSSLYQPLMCDAEQAASNLCQQPLHIQTIMQSGGHQNGQAGAHGQGQFLPYQHPVYHPPGIDPSFLSLRLNNGVLQMPAIGVVNGEVVYGVPPDVKLTSYVNLLPPSQNNIMANKRRCGSSEDDGRPYVKKPPNAFMLFMRENRAKVAANHSAAANSLLGQMWKSISKEDRVKYKEKAEKEKLLHIMRFPDWSCKDNYGKKRRRIRKKLPNITIASPSDPDINQTVVMDTSAPDLSDDTSV